MSGGSCSHDHGPQSENITPQNQPGEIFQRRPVGPSQQILASASLNLQSWQLLHGRSQIRRLVLRQCEGGGLLSRGGFEGIRSGHGGRDFGKPLGSFLHVRVENVGPQLPVQQVGAESGHRKQQEHRNYGDKNIRRNQPVAKTPEKMSPRPQESANHSVSESEHSQKFKEAALKPPRE